MTKNISQADARRYKKRVEALELTLHLQKGRWRSEYAPGWVNIETLTLTPESYAKVSTARLLGNAVVLTCDDGYKVRLYAEKQG